MRKKKKRRKWKRKRGFLLFGCKDKMEEKEKWVETGRGVHRLFFLSPTEEKIGKKITIFNCALFLGSPSLLWRQFLVATGHRQMHQTRENASIDRISNGSDFVSDVVRPDMVDERP